MKVMPQENVKLQIVSRHCIYKASVNIDIEKGEVNTFLEKKIKSKFKIQDAIDSFSIEFGKEMKRLIKSQTNDRSSDD